MIELIFAIVIIAIVVISLPLMMKTNEDAMEGNVVQEALFASSAKMMQILSYPWDQNSTDSSNPNTYGKVVDILGPITTFSRRDANNTPDANSNYRVGHILEDNHRRFHDYTLPNKNASSITPGGNSALNNIGATNTPFDNPVTSATGYKNNYTMDVGVSYISDNSFSGSTFIFSTTPSSASNMKLITVTIKDSNGNPLTLLRSYSSNIGEFDFAKRRF